MLIDHAVVDLTGLTVVLILWKNDSPAKIGFHLGYKFRLHRILIQLVCRPNSRIRPGKVEFGRSLARKVNRLEVHLTSRPFDSRETGLTSTWRWLRWSPIKFASPPTKGESLANAGTSVE